MHTLVAFSLDLIPAMDRIAVPQPAPLVFASGAGHEPGGGY
jgi:hypothetical protein